MRSLLRRVKERKKSRRLGDVEVMERGAYQELEVDSKVEMIRALVPVGLEFRIRSLNRGLGHHCVAPEF